MANRENGLPSKWKELKDEIFDAQIVAINTGYFRNQVHFLTVSQSPNLKIILETMWDKIVRRKRPEFENVEDARKQLQDQLLMQCEPTLVILDDVWSRANLEKLLFEGPAYKTLVTTRDSSTIPRNPSTRVYQLPLLGQDDALALFCFWAFGQTSIPDTADANLVKEVQSKCKGLPLALKVIGSSLRGEPSLAWECAKNRLSEGLPISDYHKDALLKCLETSIDLLDHVARECFLDMGSFPKDTKICVEALLDIWVYVRKLEWQDAFIVLLELASRNLLNLTSTPGSQVAISHGNASELYFYQHDLIRDLALYMGCQGPLLQRKRLVMPRKERSLPSKWELVKDTSFDAQIVSIHTGPMDETHWFEMNFPETEALILIFSAREYILPPFLKSMKKLKFLMVFNYGPNRATVKGLESLSSITELRSIRLERLIAPSFHESLHNTEKLSLTLCEGFGNPLTFNNSNLSLKLPMLQSFNMDHCIDLEELPPSISGMVSALMLSITNCHQVYKLPYELGNLSSLRVLRLSALPCLEELPPSIGKLGQLEYLDISLNECLRGLPDEIGQLKELMEIDMRECSRLRKLPRTVCALTSLRHVICDDKIGKEWVKAKGFAITGLRVEIVAPEYSLDWLDH